MGPRARWDLGKIPGNPPYVFVSPPLGPKRGPRLRLQIEGKPPIFVELHLVEAPHHVSALVDCVRRGRFDGQPLRVPDCLLGYGLDWKGLYRNLRSVWAVLDIKKLHDDPTAYLEDAYGPGEHRKPA